MPIQPLLVKARGVDVIIAIDAVRFSLYHALFQNAENNGIVLVC